MLQAWPGLLRHVVRAVLTNWFQYRGQSWGHDYFALICSAAPGSDIPLLKRVPIGVSHALSRSEPAGDALLAACMQQWSASEVHQHLRVELGLRDSWLYTGQVLASWVEVQLTRKQPMDDAIEDMRRDPRLRALLLPAQPGSAEAVAGVRADTLTHARAVAGFLRAGFSQPPLLGQAHFSDLTNYVLQSSFRDPRLPPLSPGWALVKQMAEEPFRKLVASLSEQDLEVFFAHAMNEPDRRAFWTRYLPHIERTGCVLDIESQRSLKAKLETSSELKAAISRAYRFRRASGVQAFFLVFSRIVVVEFSDRGNAAYVYDRDFFEQKMEQNIRAQRCDSARALKDNAAQIHKIAHHRNWQEAAAEWLSGRGIHTHRRRG